MGCAQHGFASYSFCTDVRMTKVPAKNKKNKKHPLRATPFRIRFFLHRFAHDKSSCKKQKNKKHPLRATPFRIVFFLHRCAHDKSSCKKQKNKKPSAARNTLSHCILFAQMCA